MTTDPPTADAARAALAEAGQTYAVLRRVRDRALAELEDAMRAADAAGVSRAEIIRLSGVAKQTVYDALQKRSASEDAS